MHNVDIVVGIDRDADSHANAPIVRQRFGPHGIDFEARCLNFCLRTGRVGLAVHRTARK